MNNFFKDNFSHFFNDPNEMLDVSRTFKESSEWFKVSNNDISVEMINEGSEIPESVSEDVILDTVQNTQLLVRVADNALVLPVRTCAVPSILRRAGFACEVAGKLSKKRLAELLTEFFPINGGSSILHKSFEKLSFAGAGGTYAPMEPYDLLNILYDKIEERFKDYDFQKGFISHYETHMCLAITSMQEEITRAYDKVISGTDSDSRELLPIIRFSTSELGDSAVHLTGKLRDTSAKREIGIGSIFEVVHKGSSTMKTFEDNCGKIYSHLLKSTENLNRLFDTEIDLPIDCMKHIGKSLGFRKKDLDPYFSETVNLFLHKHGNKPTNAGELYWVLSEMVSLMQMNGFSDAAITVVEEKLMTTLSPRFSWSHYDYKAI